MVEAVAVAAGVPVVAEQMLEVDWRRLLRGEEKETLGARLPDLGPDRPLLKSPWDRSLPVFLAQFRVAG